MATWDSPRSSYGAGSPTSPLTPLSQYPFPRWLRATRTRSALTGNSKIRMFAVAALCIALGFVVTTMFSSNQDVYERIPYEAASAGTLKDPSRFKIPGSIGARPGIIEDAETKGKVSLEGHRTEPSVSGALADLHHAVSSKLKSWNPYFAKTSSSQQLAANETVNKSPNATASLLGESIKDGIEESDRLGARVRIGKCTILFRGNDFWERCIRTHEQHDRQHGYRLHVLRQELMDDVWSKPAYILSLLLRELAKPQSDRLDWLFWVDSDTIILNPYISIETFLPPPGTEFDDVYLMYSNDWNGLNNGVFPIRVNQWAVNLFSAIVAYRHFKPDVPLQFRDQSAMNNLMQEPEFARHIMQAPQRWFNAYQGEHNETLQPFQVRRGDLLVHFAGVSPREERMQFWLERAEQHLEEWEIPVKSTSYPEEAKEFWRQQRGLRRDREQRLQKVKDEAIHLISATEERLRDYGDRLDNDQRMNIAQHQEMLRKILEDGSTKDDSAKIADGTRGLSDSAVPLNNAVTEANKILLQSAHEAIFAGEKDLMEGGFGEGQTSPELDQISQLVKTLKNMIMTPEETWNRQDIIAATNAVTEARARQQEKLAASQLANQIENPAQPTQAEASDITAPVLSAEEASVSASTQSTMATPTETATIVP